MTLPTTPIHAAPTPHTRDPIPGLRLLLVADSSSTHTHRWAAWFRDRGAAVSVLSCSPEPIAGVNVIPFPPQSRWYHRIPKARVALDYPTFLRLIRQINPQLVHIHFVSEGGRAFYWHRLAVPLLASSWGQDVIFDEGPRPRAETSLRRIFSRCRFITATTHQLAAATARFTPPNTPIYIIPFGVDLARFPLRSPEPRTPLVLGFVKHLLPKYGPDVLLEAFALIHRARPNTRLVLAGRGPLREALQRRIAELKLSHAIDLLGRVPHDQVPALIRTFDIMLMPSIYDSETFGVAAIEASASGVPVIASRVGGVPEAVLHEQTGLLVPPRDVHALAAACINLIDDPHRRRRLGLAGRRFVERYYVWPHNARQMEQLYHAALTADSPPHLPTYRLHTQPHFEIPPAGT